MATPRSWSLLTLVGPSSSGYSLIQDSAASTSSTFLCWDCETSVDELSPDVHLERCRSTGKGWRWRGCAGAGQGGLQGSPGSPAGVWWQQPKLQCRWGNPHGITSPRTAGTHELQQLLGKALSFWQRENRGEQAYWLNFSWV